jgi:hypothetical protein
LTQLLHLATARQLRHDIPSLAIMFGAGVVAYLIGWACRYVLRG